MNLVKEIYKFSNKNRYSSFPSQHLKKITSKMVFLYFLNTIFLCTYLLCHLLYLVIFFFSEANDLSKFYEAIIAILT